MNSKFSHALIIAAAIVVMASLSSAEKLRIADPKGPALTMQAESGLAFTIDKKAAANQRSLNTGNVVYTPRDKNMRIASFSLTIVNTTDSPLQRIDQNDVFFVYLPPGATEAKVAPVDMTYLRSRFLKGTPERKIENTLQNDNREMRPREFRDFYIKAVHEKDSSVFALFVMPSTYIRFVSDPKQASTLDAAFERFKAEQGFIAACSTLPYPAIEELMKSSGYTMETCNAKGVTPLIAAIASGNASAVGGLLNAGANAREKTHYQQNEVEAIHVAAIQGSPEVIELLVKNGADVHVRAMDLKTPLAYAVISNKLEAVKRLISLGADAWSDRFSTGLFNPPTTPLEYAAKHNYNEIRDYLMSLEIAK